MRFWDIVVLSKKFTKSLNVLNALTVKFRGAKLRGA